MYVCMYVRLEGEPREERVVFRPHRDLIFDTMGEKKQY